MLRFTIFDFFYFIYNNKKENNMKRQVQKKVIISVSLNPDIVDILNDKTSNRSQYLDYVLLQYFHSLGEDITKIKL
jgi:hypothetical protein